MCRVLASAIGQTNIGRATHSPIYLLHTSSLSPPPGAPPTVPTGMKADFPMPKSCVLIITCSLLYSLSFFADLLLKGLLHVVGHHIYGYTIVMDLVAGVSWFFSLLLIYREKVKMVLQQAHGCNLTLFWMLNLVWLGLEVVSYNYSSWWWRLESRADVADMVVWLVRCLLLTVLLLESFHTLCYCRGRRNYVPLLLNVDPLDKALISQYGSITASFESTGSSDRKQKEGDFVTTKTNSAFANLLSKSRLLFPYVWPKGACSCTYTSTPPPTAAHTLAHLHTHLHT